MNKKVVLSILVLLAVCLIVHRIEANENVTPMPDSIIVYSVGTTKTFVPDSESYKTIYNSLKVDSYDFFETMIDEDTVEQAKENLAVEYCYDEDVVVSDSEISCSKILFFLSGWCEGEAAFFNDDKYESGTISFSCTDKQKKAIIELLNN